MLTELLEARTISRDAIEVELLACTFLVDVRVDRRVLISGNALEELFSFREPKESSSLCAASGNKGFSPRFVYGLTTGLAHLKHTFGWHSTHWLLEHRGHRNTNADG